jgi:hypothetical protein
VASVSHLNVANTVHRNSQVFHQFAAGEGLLQIVGRDLVVIAAEAADLFFEPRHLLAQGGDQLFEF